MIRTHLTLVLIVVGLQAGCVPPAQPIPGAVPESMVVVPAGWYLMGADTGPRSNRPQRPVYLDAFAIDRTEVTREAFAGFVQETGALTAGWESQGGQTQALEPVTGVLWREADAYCRWAGLRLPTEAEWEKAARGTDGRSYPWGNEWDDSLANTLERGSGGPVPVGSFQNGASPYGALDMAGNVAEWVADTFDPDYYTYGPDRNPTGPQRVMDHVLRGGSWALSAWYAQTFVRDSSHSARPNPRVGFRCALPLGSPGS